MGWFSSKTKTYVFHTAQRMLGDDNFVSSNQQAMKQYIYQDSLNLTNKTSLTDLLIQNKQNSLPVNLNKIYKYANITGNYIFGLPTESLVTDVENQLKSTLQNYLNTKEDKTVSIIYSDINYQNFEHYAWLKLIQLFNYSGLNNELKNLSNEKQTPCYLYDGYFKYTEEANKYTTDKMVDTVLPFNYGKCFNRSENARNTKTANQLSTTGLNEFVFSYQYKDSDGTLITETKTIDMSFINLTSTDNQYIQVGYKVDNEYKFFTYQFLSGGITEIDSAIKFDEGIGTYYPRLYVRTDKVTIINGNDDLKIKHSKDIFRLLGLDYSKVSKDIIKSIPENELGNVNDIYIDMSVAIKDAINDEVLTKYLYEYFNRIHVKYNKDSGLISQDNYTANIIKYSEIKKETITGKFDEKLKYKCEIADTSYTNNNNLFSFSGTKDLIIYYQKSDTSYIKLTIGALISSHDINGNVTDNNLDNENCTIPLDKNIVDTLDFKEQEKLLYKSLTVHITTIQQVKEKWYQSSIFKIVMTAISIAITILTAGAGATLTSVIQQTVINTAISMATSIAIGAIAKIAVDMGVDPKLVGVLAFVATVASITYANGIDLSKAFNANTIMKALNTSFKFYEKSIQLTINKLTKELKDTELEYKNKVKDLDKKRKMLLTQVIPMDLELLTSPVSQSIYINFGETVEQFYTRTMTVDVIGLTQVIASDYVKITTTLPSFQETYHKYKNQRNDFDIESILYT